MPDSTPEDPFADLYGKLPDPRTRGVGSGTEQPVSGSSTTPGTGEGVPLSRRAAREAARRAATGETAVPAASPPRSDAASERASEPVTLSQTQVDEDLGFLASSEDRATEPYSRTGVAAARPSAEARAAGAAGSARAGEGGRGAAAGTATLDDLFSGSTSTDEVGHVPPPKNKRRRRIGGWIALGIVLVILGGIAGGGWYVWTTYEDKIREVMGWEEPKDYEAGLANGEAFVTIASGDTGMPISHALHEAGVTKTPEAFYDYLIEEGLNPPFQPGVYKLQKQMTSAAALEALLEPANKMENTAQIPEGLTVEQTIGRLAEGTGIPAADFEAAVADPSAYGVSADSLEGWLFPATYTFDPGVTAQQVVQTMVDRAVQSLDAAEVPVERRQEILTIASIIQREARFEADMQKVSRVIQNRLDPTNQETFGLLQMDSTAQYGYGEMHDGTASSSAEALADDNPWNTYVHAGLPVGPISNPGDVAINAAMHPADGDWLYFVTVNLDTGETVFTSNLADHNRAVAQWQEWCSEHPDSGC